MAALSNLAQHGRKNSQSIISLRCTIAHHRTVSVIVALSIASAAYAQESLKGEVVTVDKASKKIGIKLSGTVGSSDATAPTPFKVQDARMFKLTALIWPFRKLAKLHLALAVPLEGLRYAA